MFGFLLDLISSVLRKNMNKINQYIIIITMTKTGGRFFEPRLVNVSQIVAISSKNSQGNGSLWPEYCKWSDQISYHISELPGNFLYIMHVLGERNKYPRNIYLYSGYPFPHIPFFKSKKIKKFDIRNIRSKSQILPKTRISDLCPALVIFYGYDHMKNKIKFKYNIYNQLVVMISTLKLK